MDNFVKMDVFFVITTLAIIAISVGLGLLFYRVYRILKHVERITEQVSDEANLIKGDIAQVRMTVMREGFKLRQLGSLFGVMKARAKRPHKRESDEV